MGATKLEGGLSTAATKLGLVAVIVSKVTTSVTPAATILSPGITLVVTRAVAILIVGTVLGSRAILTVILRVECHGLRIK